MLLLPGDSHYPKRRRLRLGRRQQAAPAAGSSSDLAHQPAPWRAPNSLCHQGLARRNHARGRTLQPRATGGGLAVEAGGEQQPASSSGFARVVLPTALALLLCNMDRICLR